MTVLSLDARTPFQRFEKNYHDLFSLVQRTSPALQPDARLIHNVSWITLVDYFDTFCRQQFVAIARLLPEQKFGLTAGDSDGLSVLFTTHGLNLDSGDAMNDAFSFLIGRMPLSKDECLQYATIQAQRLKLLYMVDGESSLPESMPTLASFTWFEMADVLFDLAINITRVTTLALQSKLDPTSENFTVITSEANRLLEARFDRLA